MNATTTEIFKVIGYTDGVKYDVGSANSYELAQALAGREVKLNIECDWVVIVAPVADTKAV